MANQILENSDYYSLVADAGLCLVGDDIVNLRKITLIRKQEGKTLIYYPGAKDPIILPLAAFETIRETVFAIEELGDDEDLFQDDEDDEGDEDEDEDEE